MVTDEIGVIYRATASTLVSKTDEPYQLCDKYSKILQRLTIAILCFNSLLVIGDAVPPLVLYILTGVASPSFGLEFPAVDKRSYLGMAVLLGFESVAMFPAIVLITLFDLIILAIFLNLSVTSKIIVAHIHRLERDLEAKRVDARAAKRRLIELMLMHQIYNR